MRGNRVRQVQAVDVETFGLSAQLESPSPVGRWVYGAEYYRDWVDSSYAAYDANEGLASVRVQGPVADDAFYDLVGVYAEDHLPLLDERLHLFLGGRFNYAAADANRIRNPADGSTFSLADSWNDWVGSGRVLYELDPDQHLAVFGGASQGFRAPNLSDLTRWDADWGQEIPSPGVDPEHFLSLEAGVRADYSRFEAEAVYFHTLFDDMIVRVPTGEMAGDIPIVTKMNSGEGYVHGVELSGSVELYPG
ncbi:TonB-dependent receptor, partial [bacterium]|nr:TonB-dependent receptor [bacterium]